MPIRDRGKDLGRTALVECQVVDDEVEIVALILVGNGSAGRDERDGDERGDAVVERAAPVARRERRPGGDAVVVDPPAPPVDAPPAPAVADPPAPPIDDPPARGGCECNVSRRLKMDTFDHEGRSPKRWCALSGWTPPCNPAAHDQNLVPRRAGRDPGGATPHAARRTARRHGLRLEELPRIHCLLGLRTGALRRRSRLFRGARMCRARAQSYGLSVDRGPRDLSREPGVPMVGRRLRRRLHAIRRSTLVREHERLRRLQVVVVHGDAGATVPTLPGGRMPDDAARMLRRRQ